MTRVPSSAETGGSGSPGLAGPRAIGPAMVPERLARLERALAEENPVRRAELLLPLLPLEDAALCRRVVERLLRSQTGLAGRKCLEAALRELVERDLEVALRLAAEAPPGPGFWALERIGDGLEPTRLPPALARLTEQQRAAVRRAARLREPDAAFEQAATEADHVLLCAALERLVEREGGAAAGQRLGRLPANPKLDLPTLRACLITPWARRDPAAALAWALTQPTSEQRQLVFRTLIAAAAAQPAKAAEFVLARLTGEQRSDALASVARAWFRSDPERAVAWLKSLPKLRDQSDAAQQIVPGWAQLEPEAAAAFVSQLPRRADGQSLWYLVAEAWSLRAPRAAGAWLRTLPTGESRTEALRGFVEGTLAGADDPQAILAVLGELPLGPADSSAVRRAIARLAELDFEQAVAWTRRLPDRSLAGPALAELVERRARTDPAAAFALLEEWWVHGRDLPGRIGSELIVATDKLLATWAERDASAAARWLAAAPPDVQHGMMADRIARAWAARDPAAALAWFSAPGTALQPDGVRAVFLAVTPRDPPAALRLAATLPAGDLRRIANRAIRTEWMRVDQNSALAWLARERPDLQPPLVSFGVRYPEEGHAD